MNTPPKKHHTHSRFILQNFADEAGHLHVWDKVRQNRYKGRAESVFFEKHLYRFFDPAAQAFSYEVETELGHIESDAAPVVQKIVELGRRRKSPRLSHDERRKWARLYYAQARRTRENLALCLEADDRLDAEARALGLTLHEVDGMIMERGMPFFASGTDPRLRANEYSDSVGLMTAVLIQPQHGFVIGSCGVPLGPYEAELDPFFRGWLPLSPDVAVRATIWPDKEILVPIPFEAESIVRRMNRVTAAKSRVVAGRSEDDIAAIRGIP